MESSCDYDDTTDYNELFLAVHNGDVNLVNSLLGKYSTTTTIRGRTLLHVATANGHTELAKLFTTKRDETGNTPLHLAIMRNQPLVFSLLLEETNLNARNFKEERPLHYAVLYNRPEFAKILLNNDATVEVKNKEGKTPLYVALEMKNVQMAEILFKHGAVLNENDLTHMGPLRKAVRNGNFEMVKLLMANGCNKVDIPTFDGSALKLAVHSGRLDILQYLIKNGEKSSATINKDELHLFETSIKMKHLDILKYLVEVGLKTETANNTFFDLIKHRRYESWEYLLKCFSKINAKTHFLEKQLHFSVRMNKVETIKATLKDNEIFYRLIPFARQLAVYIAVETGNEEILEILLENGSPIDSVFKFISPLHVAATFEHPRLVKLLLNAGADVNSQTEDGLTPLHFAAISVQPAVVKFLLENGADACKTCNYYKEPPFGLAVAMFGTNLPTRNIPPVMFERLTKITKMLTTSMDKKEIERLYIAAVTIRVLNISNLNPDPSKVKWTDYSEFRPDIINWMASYQSDEALRINTETVLNDFDSSFTPELMQLMMDYNDSKSCSDIEINGFDNASHKCKLLMIGYTKNIDDLLSINKVEDFLFDTDDNCVQEDRTEFVKLIVARLVLLTEDNHPGVIKYCLDNDVCDLRENCLKEKMDMKETKINENMIVTFYDVLTKSTNEVAKYTSNNDFVKAIESSDAKFPIYADFLKTSVEVAERRRAFINECTTLMFRLVQKCHKIRISRADIGHIFQYLSIIDLRKFSVVCS